MAISQKSLDGSDEDCDNTGQFSQANVHTESWTGDPAFLSI